MQNVSVAILSNNHVSSPFSNVYSLFDTGSPRSFISEQVVPRIECHPKLSEYRGLGNGRLTTLGQVECLIRFRRSFVQHSFIIIPSNQTAWPMIIGRDLLEKLKVNLSYKRCAYSINELLEARTTNKVALQSNIERRLLTLDLMKNNSTDLMNNNATAIGFDARVLSAAFSELCAIEISATENHFDVGSNLNFEQSLQLNCVIQKDYLEFTCEVKANPDHSMSINLTSDTPIFCKPRRLSFAERNQVKTTVHDLLEKNIIRPSNSP